MGRSYGYHTYYNAVAPNRAGKGRIGGRLGVGMYPDPETIAAAMWYLGKELVDWRPAWEQLAPMVRNELGKIIGSGAGPEGEKWPDLDAKYKSRKRADGYARTALHRSWRLHRSLLNPSNTRITRMYLKAGTDLPYARTQHFGYKGVSKFMANELRGAINSGRQGSGNERRWRESRGASARPFVGVNQAMRDRSFDVISRRANEILAQAVAKMNAGAPSGETPRATSEHIVKAFRNSDYYQSWQKGKKYL